MEQIVRMQSRDASHVHKGSVLKQNFLQKKKKTFGKLRTVSIFVTGFLAGQCQMYFIVHPHVLHKNTVPIQASYYQNGIQFSNTEKPTTTYTSTMNLTEIQKRVGGWPNPTIVVGLPKAGTSSLAEYFTCGGIERVSHHRCQNRACGALIQKNIKQHRRPFYNTGRSNVYTQIDVEFNVQKGLPCYFPQIEALHEIHKAHPQSTFILNTRNVTAWVESIKRWHGMHRRFALCNISGFPPETDPSDNALEYFFKSQSDRIRNFVNQYPSHKLVEVPIDSPLAGEILENTFGIQRSCWGHQNRNRHSKDKEYQPSHSNLHGLTIATERI